MMFIKTTFEVSRNFKIIKSYVLKYNLRQYFLILQKMLISGEKMLMSAKRMGVSRDLYSFWNFFG